MVLPVIGAGLTAKQIKEKLEENKKREQSRNPDPKTPKIDTDNKESESTKKLKNPPVILVIDGKKYTVQSLSDIGKINKGEKKLQPTLPISPEQQNNKGEKKLQQTLPKSSKKIKTLEEAKNKKTLQPAFNKGGRVGYKTGTRGCKLAMKGKGRAYGKNS